MPRGTHIYLHCILPIFTLFMWIPAIIDYTANNVLKLYAILDVALCVFILGFSWWPARFQPIIFDLYSYFRVINMGLGMLWFELVQGRSILTMPMHQVQQSPLMVQIMFLQLWILFTFYLLLFALYRQRIIDHYGSIIEIWILYHKFKTESGARMIYKGWVLGQKSCTICEEEYGEDVDLYILDCGHAFHVSCIQRWEGYAIQTCPNCRAIVTIPE